MSLFKSKHYVIYNMNSLIFKAVQDFITQSGRFAVE